MNLTLTLHRDSADPLYEQVAKAVRSQVCAGSLVPGDQLPTEHILSRALGINRLTVGRAYQELASQGLITKQRGAGTFIADLAPDKLGTQRRRSLKHIAFVQPGSPADPIQIASRFIFSELLAGICDVARKLNAHISILQAGQGQDNPELLDDLRDRLPAFDGAIFACRPESTQHVLDLMGNRVIPAVQLWYDLNDPRVASVNYNHKQAVGMAVDLLHEAGHQRVGYVGLDDRKKSFSKLGAFIKLTADCGMTFDLRDFVPASQVFGSAQRAVKQRLRNGWCDDLPQALFVDTDFKAFETIYALEAAGLNVPDDIALVSYDGIAESEGFVPALSTVRTPRTSMGRAAVECLSGWLDGTPAPKPITLAPHVLARQTHVSSKSLT